MNLIRDKTSVIQTVSNAKIGVLLFLVTLLPFQSSFSMVDGDNNGVSDVWERLYGAGSLDPSADEDSDGTSNFAESVFGTDPFDSSSCLKVSGFRVISNGLLIQWEGSQGIEYHLESSGILGVNWNEIATIAKSQDGMRTALIEKPQASSAFYRIAVKGSPVGTLFSTDETFDSDHDGQSDAKEFLAGTDAFDPSDQLAISKIGTGSGVTMDFPSIVGKSYRIQSLQASTQTWVDEGVTMTGTGAVINASLVVSNPSLFLRIKVLDLDSDSDGVTDWEEKAVGLKSDRARSPGGDDSDLTHITTMLATPLIYKLSSRRPTATVGRIQPGIIEIVRAQGLGSLNIPLTLTGNAQVNRDYLPLPEYVKMPFGESRILVPVQTTPMAVSGTNLSVSAGGSLATSESTTINFRKVSALNVRDFGAIGNGVVDDTNAIQAAINALADSTIHNSLHFPAGIYTLKKSFFDDNTGSGQRRQLIVDSPNLAGRDLSLTGDPGAVIHSETGTLRAHMLLVISSFRSLEFHGLTFSQGTTPRSAVPFGQSPNGCDGVSLVRHGDDVVEAVTFDNCVFDNCHGAVFCYGTGYDVRGNLKQFGMYNCRILNPYGANTLNSGIAYGGGIQVGISTWVGTAVYDDNFFEGGGEDMTDTSKSPGGRLLDGCHFGNPSHLEFTNNIVKKMGVEAVFQTGGSTYTGLTIESFTMPAADGSSVTSVRMDNLPSTFLPGDIINVRTPSGPTPAGVLRIMVVDSFDSSTRRLFLRNSGNALNPPSGSFVPASAQVYMDKRDESSTAVISSNVIDGSLPPGTNSDTNPAGIVVNSRSIISNNTITEFQVGILLYPEVQTILHPGSRYSIVEKNTVITRDSLQAPEFYTYGIQSSANDDFISDNLVATPNSFRFLGITARGENTRIENNRVISLVPADNGYGHPNRSVGISFGNQSINTFIRDNTTYGFDVGTGPESANQDIPHSVINHRSVNDILGVDPRGLLPN